MLKYTDLKCTDRQDLMEVLPLPKPFTVLVEPTSVCCFRCVMCFQSLPGSSYFTDNRMHMPLERFARVIDQLAAWEGPKVKVLKLSLYGEPLLNPDFAAMVRMAHAAEVSERMETTTNAALLTPEIAEALIDAQMDYMRVSIYAADAERHRKVTNSAVTPAQIHENLRMLQEMKAQRGSQRPFVSCKMLDSFDTENEAFMAMYADVADEVYLDKPHGWIGVEGAEFIESYYEEDLATAVADMQENSTARIACPMPFTTMTVRSNGDVSPCCVDFIGGTNLGNMEESSLEEIWRSDAWYEFQKMQLEGRKDENSSCARCDIYLSDHYTRDNIDGFPVERLR